MKLVLLEGEDIYLKLKNLNIIKEKFSNLKEGVSYFKYDKIDLEDLIYEIEMPSFFGGEKLIILEDERYLKQSEKECKKIVEYLNEIKVDINIELVFISNQKLRDTNKLKKLFLEKGQIINISNPSDNEIRKEIIDYLEKRNGFIEYKNIIYFIDSVGKDLYKIINELDKVLSYVKQKNINKNKKYNISKQDIDKIIIKNQDAKMYEITKALEIDDKNNAIKIINENFETKTKMLGLISYLYTYYIDIYYCKEAKENGINPASIINLPPNRSFIINIYKKIADKMSMKKIKYILKELSRIDFLSKSDNLDTLILLKALIMYI